MYNAGEGFFLTSELLLLLAAVSLFFFLRPRKIGVLVATVFVLGLIVIPLVAFEIERRDNLPISTSDPNCDNTEIVTVLEKGYEGGVAFLPRMPVVWVKDSHSSKGNSRMAINPDGLFEQAKVGQKIEISFFNCATLKYHNKIWFAAVKTWKFVD
ncbi:MAG: hypothetical protein A2651_02940 [Candidatus Yanofskybacteria bacterium RIFCSPHIGHO2_01_FULL_42_12]|nr:MAG: hypothetical protein A2651_02940 [Candidatus Yanofskybacteria bacterium RIFCSPHIGHO2_01_FULL_42_12]